MLKNYRALVASEEPQTISAGTVFTTTSPERNAQLAAEYPDALVLRPNGLEALKEFNLTTAGGVLVVSPELASKPPPRRSPSV